jgi:predicted CXXCH cytochrome family protein
MKNNVLKPRFFDIAVVALSVFVGANVSADIANTKHNLGTTGTGPNTFSGTAALCVFCHTPHGGDSSASVPLWNKSLITGTYVTYDSLGTSSLDGATAPVGSVSIACLSCHDGTQAMDTVLNQPGSGAVVASYGAGTWVGNSTPQGIALIGEDLTNDHPVGIQYGGGGITATAPSAATNDVDFVAPNNASINSNVVWWVDTGTPNGTREKTDMQLYTRSVVEIDAGADQPFVECASCHDPHSEQATFLRIANDGSAVCLACHTK